MLNSQFKSLMANILREQPGSYVTEEIFKRFPSIIEIMNASESELTNIAGVGPVKAKAIVSALQLAKCLNSPQGSPYVIRSPQDVFDYIKNDIMYEHREHFIILMLNTKNHVITKEIISIGSISSAIVSCREVFKAAISRSSASIIAIHQHPSGDPTPSSEDISITARLVECGELLNIPVLDHCIIGNQCYVSMKEKGFM